MSHPEAICYARSSVRSGRCSLAVTAAAILAALALLPRATPSAMSPVLPADRSFILQADTASSLRDKVEAMRAQLLRSADVRAVIVSGLHQQRLAVEYAPRILAGLGISPAELAAGLPVDAALSGPGHIALRTDAGLDSPADVTGLPVRAGARVFRLGDVALVSRARLDPPVSDMRVGGQVAARVEVLEEK